MAWKYEDEWFEESNVASSIQRYLQSRGHAVKKFNRSKRMKGPDLITQLGGQEYIIEVKGYPSDKYVIGPRRGKKKPTDPKLQAMHWIASALFSVLAAKAKNPRSNIGIGIPDFDRYHELSKIIKTSLRNPYIHFYVVKQNGSVDEK